MGLMKELNELNALYQSQVYADVDEAMMLSKRSKGSDRSTPYRNRPEKGTVPSELEGKLKVGKDPRFKPKGSGYGSRKGRFFRSEEVNPSVQQAVEALSSIIKKKSNLGEEGYDIARDRGKVKPSKDKSDATTMPPSDAVKKTQKINTGPSALELVKKKYGKAVMDMGKK